MKKVLVLVLLISISFSAFAATWSWSSDYKNVTYYRYQLNGEEADKWTVVNKDVTSVSLDTEETAMLFVQQSLDYGQSWSKSGFAEYYIEPKVVVQPVVKKLRPEHLAFHFGMSVSPFVERIYSFPFHLKNPLSVGTELELRFTKTKTNFINCIGFDIDLGFSLLPFEKLDTTWLPNMFNTDYTVYRIYTDVLADIGYDGKNVSFVTSFGLGLSLFRAPDMGFTNVGDYSLIANFAYGATFDYKFTKNFKMGLDYKGHLDFSPMVNRQNLSVRIGVNF
ncbi:MAG: hypothetical protein GX903_00695 [Spirochaetales bacterium]|nr:hypothetical protein [Spirochaetales bacterium]